MGDRGMDRLALDLQRQPHHAHLRMHDPVEWFRDDGGIGAIALHQAGERTVAGAFLFHHRLQNHLGGRLQPHLLQRLHGEDIGDNAGLHVAGTATVEFVAVDPGLEGRPGPQPLRADRHHVDMTIEDQRFAPRAMARPVRADDIVPAVVGDDRGRIAGMCMSSNTPRTTSCAPFSAPSSDGQRTRSERRATASSRRLPTAALISVGSTRSRAADIAFPAAFKERARRPVRLPASGGLAGPRRAAWCTRAAVLRTGGPFRRIPRSCRAASPRYGRRAAPQRADRA